MASGTLLLRFTQTTNILDLLARQCELAEKFSPTPVVLDEEVGSLCINSRHEMVLSFAGFCDRFSQHSIHGVYRDINTAELCLLGIVISQLAQSTEEVQSLRL